MIEWDTIKNIASDSQLYAKNEAQANSREYWLWYFLSESLEGAKSKPDHQTRVCDVLDKYFEKNTDKSDQRILKLKRTNPQTAPLLDTADAATLRGDLTKLLLIGFKCVGADPGEIKSLKNAYGTYRTKQRDDTVTKRTHLEKGYLKVIPANQPLIVWRSAQVPLTDIKKDVEIRAKVDIENKARERNITADFNPFSDAKVRSFYWFRKKMTDNDCQALASVGNTDDWRNVAAFPLLNSYGKKYKVRANLERGNDRIEKELVAADVTMVLFLLHGTVMDTNELQRHYQKAGFPEFGIKKVDQNNVYGAITFTRVHHGDGMTDDSTGFTIFHHDKWVQYSSWQEAQGNFTDSEEVYNKTKAKFDKAWTDIVNDTKKLKWAMDGFEEDRSVVCEIPNPSPSKTPPTLQYKVTAYQKI